jgi:hypothetical protein
LDEDLQRNWSFIPMARGKEMESSPGQWEWWCRTVVTLLRDHTVFFRKEIELYERSWKGGSFEGHLYFAMGGKVEL